MSAPFTPNSEPVAGAWLATLPGITADMCSTRRPADEKYAEKGFVTYQVVGGTPNNYTGERLPVVTFDFWGVNVGSQKAPWAKTASLGEVVMNGCFSQGDIDYIGPIVLPASITGGAIVSAVNALTELRRVPDDSDSVAHYSVDVEIQWIREDS